MHSLHYEPIGVIHSPLREQLNSPIQAISAKGIAGSVEIFPRFMRGLKDIGGFSNIILVYHFHKVGGLSLTVKPFLDPCREHGIFSTRAPVRPNPIGISVVKLERVSRQRLYVSDLDILDKTPLLDVKPYLPEFDCRKSAKIGWYAGRIKNFGRTLSDQRFSTNQRNTLKPVTQPRS